MQTILKWLVMTAAVLVASYLLEGIRVSNFLSAIFAAAALGILNAFFRPVLIIMTLPVNILSLGLFTFLINAFLLKLAAFLIPGFYVEGFWTAVFGSLLISIVSWVLNSLITDGRKPPKRDPGYIDLEKKGDRWE
ncbi:MAG TPA: phage holin family protein [Syntrophales bacterium]|nr:phage holin family protein [Syntrophales bacterium]